MGGGGGGGLLGSGFTFGSTFGGSGITAVALIPGWLNRNASGFSRSVPVQLISTLVPALAPHGLMVSSRGLGSWLPSCGCAPARPLSNNPPSTATAIVPATEKRRLPCMHQLLQKSFARTRGGQWLATSGAAASRV